MFWWESNIITWYKTKQNKKLHDASHPLYKGCTMVIFKSKYFKNNDFTHNIETLKSILK